MVNLNSPRCVRHGVVVHELMHAIGFFHQQSAANRDEHVKINWENIRDGREVNFKKYNSSAVNDFEIGYDYGSVMHYGTKAFSRNGLKTIEPLVSRLRPLLVVSIITQTLFSVRIRAPSSGNAWA